METEDQNLLRPQGEDENGLSIESVLTLRNERNMTRMKYLKERSEVGAGRFKVARTSTGG